MNFVLTLLLAVCTLAAISIQKTFARTPAKELKRRAQKGDELAALMHKAAAYGADLTVLLWAIVGVFGTALFWIMARWLPSPLAIVGIVSIIWFGFAWLPNSRVTSSGLWLVRIITPVVVWVLSYIHPVLERIGHRAKKQAAHIGHTRLYQREDFLELLDRQKAQPDNRITQEELDIAAHALTFGDKLVRDILTPRSQVKVASVADPIGPVLLDELHASGHSRFPVFGEQPETVVGILYLRDLIKKNPSGTVANHMRPEVFYLHEEQNLHQALQAFLKTKHHLFVVVNNFEEVVGIVTIEDVLEQIIGKPIIDEFDQYEDIRAVAAQKAAKIHKAQKHDTPEPAPAGPEPPEVVE